MNYLLQAAPQVIEKGSNFLLQYGVLGVFALLMITVIWYLEKQRSKQMDEMKSDKLMLIQRIVKLETKLEDMQEQTICKLEGIIIENTKIMSKTADLMDEVKELLIKRS